MAPAISFEKRFGGANCAVDYANTRRLISNILPMPQDSDTLEEMSDKLRNIAALVEQGGSAAVATGFKTVPHKSGDYEKVGRIRMTAMEKEQYESWIEGIRVPDFDWAANKREIPAGKGNAERYTRLAKAMNIMYVRDDVTAEHASWLTENWAYALPLVNALDKVQQARHEHERQPADRSPPPRDELQRAEMHVAHLANAIASKKLNDTFRKLNQLTKSINHSKDILQAREHELRTKMLGGKHKSPIKRPRKRRRSDDADCPPDVPDAPGHTANLPQDVDNPGQASRKKRRGRQPPVASGSEDVSSPPTLHAEDGEDMDLSSGAPQGPSDAIEGTTGSLRALHKEDGEDMDVSSGAPRGAE